MSRYGTTQLSNRFDGKSVFLTTIFPPIPKNANDIFILSKEKDRFDHYAQRFYGDPNLWWVIAQANEMVNGNLAVPIGKQIRIPQNIQQIIQNVAFVNAT
jgi:hypothetical protein